MVQRTIFGSYIIIILIYNIIVNFLLALIVKSLVFGQNVMVAVYVHHILMEKKNTYMKSTYIAMSNSDVYILCTQLWTSTALII